MVIRICHFCFYSIVLPCLGNQETKTRIILPELFLFFLKQILSICDYRLNNINPGNPQRFNIIGLTKKRPHKTHANSTTVKTINSLVWGLVIEEKSHYREPFLEHKSKFSSENERLLIRSSHNKFCHYLQECFMSCQV